MANPLLSLNENFCYNSMLARALLQLIPSKDKQAISAWLYILHEMDSSLEEMTLRNEYMWFLLLQLQNKRIMAPFNQPPVSRKLQPLNEMLPPNVYMEVLNMSWMQRAQPTSPLPMPATAGPSTSGVEKARKKRRRSKSRKRKRVRKSSPKRRNVPPSQFLAKQPTPKNGIICYMCAFSDHNY